MQLITNFIDNFFILSKNIVDLDYIREQRFTQVPLIWSTLRFDLKLKKCISSDFRVSYGGVGRQPPSLGLKVGKLLFCLKSCQCIISSQYFEIFGNFWFDKHVYRLVANVLKFLKTFLCNFWQILV